MRTDLKSLKALFEQLRKLPYLSSKSLYKIGLSILEKPESEVSSLCRAIFDAKKNLKKCQICFSWVEGELVCKICQNPSREKDFICVVASWSELCLIEESCEFNGVYHILGGLISPLDGIDASDLKIEELLSRVKKNETKEIVFALNSTPEGEVTQSFIASRFDADLKIKVSRIASGMPSGCSIEYLDKVTISNALKDRQLF